jgi:hypothetical protein
MAKSRRRIMSDFYIKQMPDNTVTLITEGGHIIGKFDDIEDTSGIIFERPDSQAHLANTTQASA